MELTFTYARMLVENYAACFRFYRDTLGLELVWGDENTGYAEFQSGGVKVALFARQQMAQAVASDHLPSDADAQDRVALIFAVANVDEAYQHLSTKGVTFITEPTDRPDWSVRTAHFRDPSGNLIEINTRLDS